tara:strand:- start:11410 stop:12012 length:603 start_codon:yes stop_codon:yes gene_type:complete
LKILWIGGWGTSPDWGLTAVRRWRPDWKHEWVIPNASSASFADGSHDWVGGYSFGAFLMLRSPNDFPSRKGHFFVAPFLDLKTEAQLGGKVTTTQLKVTRRRLTLDPPRALADFYQLSGLNFPMDTTLPYSLQDLTWGIETLLGESAPLPVEDPGFAVFGSEDSLVDPVLSNRFFPENTVVEGAGHRLEALRGSVQINDG